LSYGFSKFAHWNGMGDRNIVTFELGEETVALHLSAEYRRPGLALQYFFESPVSLGTAF
jgi:hypothetical protein